MKLPRVYIFILSFSVAMASGLGYLLGRFDVPKPSYAKHEYLAYILAYNSGIFDAAKIDENHALQQATCAHEARAMRFLKQLPDFDVNQKLVPLSEDLREYCAHYKNDPSFNAPDLDDNPDGPITSN